MHTPTGKDSFFDHKYIILLANKYNSFPDIFISLHYTLSSNVNIYASLFKDTLIEKNSKEENEKKIKSTRLYLRQVFQECENFAEEGTYNFTTHNCRWFSDNIW